MSGWKGSLERIAAVLIVAGILSLCQPFVFALYRHGFAVLLVGTALFTVASHMPAPRARP